MQSLFGKNMVKILAERAYSARIWSKFLRKELIRKEFNLDSCGKSLFGKNMVEILVERAYLTRI